MNELIDKLKQEYQTYNQEQLDNAFISACSHGYLNIVSYLLTSPDLKQHADIHALNDEGFQCACDYGHLDIIKYLLTSPDLEEHADIHAENDLGFLWACDSSYLDVVKYLLSFNDDQYINFQKTRYNLDWAIKNNYPDVVFTMIKHVYQHDIDVFNAHVDTVMAYFMTEAIEYGVAMITTFDLPPTECVKEFNVTL